MKSHSTRSLTTLLLVAGIALSHSLMADGGTESTHRTDAEREDRSGTLRTLNAAERTLRLKTFWKTRTYSLGEPCQVTMEDKPRATLADLQPGHEIRILYKEHDGVRVVTEIIQVDREFTGHVAEIDFTNRTFKVERGWTTREFNVLPDCKLVLRDGTKQPFTALEIGERVTVTYLTPDDTHLAQTIDQRSLEFEGRVEMLDARTGTVRAGSLLVDRTFRLGDDCQFVINGSLDGELADLRMGDQVTFHYENVDGVLIANRIELETAAEETGTARLSSRRSQSP